MELHGPRVGSVERGRVANKSTDRRGICRDLFRIGERFLGLTFHGDESYITEVKWRYTPGTQVFYLQTASFSELAAGVVVALDVSSDDVGPG